MAVALRRYRNQGVIRTWTGLQMPSRNKASHDQDRREDNGSPLQLRQEAVSKGKHHFLVLGRCMLQKPDPGVQRAGKDMTTLVASRPAPMGLQHHWVHTAALGAHVGVPCQIARLGQSTTPTQSPCRCATSSALMVNNSCRLTCQTNYIVF